MVNAIARLPLRHNWHIGAIAEHLQAISAGHLGNLIITIGSR